MTGVQTCALPISYLESEGKIYSLSDDELAKLWFPYLKKMFPEFDATQVLERHTFRFKAAQHIVDTDYESKIPAYQSLASSSSDSE